MLVFLVGLIAELALDDLLLPEVDFLNEIELRTAVKDVEVIDFGQRDDGLF